MRRHIIAVELMRQLRARGLEIDDLSFSGADEGDRSLSAEQQAQLRKAWHETSSGSTCASLEASLPVAAYFFPPLPPACDNALPAADLEALDVRPSRSTWDAALAALGDVDSPALRL